MGEAHTDGNVSRAHDVFDAYLPMARYELQPGLGLHVRKYVLAKRGAIASATLRKPAGKLTALDIADIERLLVRQNNRLQEIG
jgi:4-hydroxy-tetrahydrodipicolinate synthase